MLVAGQKIRTDFDMQIGSHADVVEVTAETSMELADTGSSAVAGIVSSEEVEDLPIVSRKVEQVQVISSGYSAEFGRAAGGQVNVILKSGTNQYHGSEYLNRWRLAPMPRPCGRSNRRIGPATHTP